MLLSEKGKVMNASHERAKFEWWASDEGEYPRAVERVGECYKLAQIQSYWMAWQARAALQSQDREDAERYRWLRNRASHEGICVVHIDYWSDEYRGQAHCEVYDGEFLDKAIDAAKGEQA